jgi:hypothetical protein
VRVIARLIPAQEQPLAEWISSGKLRPATGTAPRPSGPIRTDREAGALLQALRDDERF